MNDGAGAGNGPLHRLGIGNISRCKRQTGSSLAQRCGLTAYDFYRVAGFEQPVHCHSTDEPAATQNYNVTRSHLFISNSACSSAGWAIASHASITAAAL